LAGKKLGNFGENSLINGELFLDSAVVCL
jgi:hypothetical protein